jgi:phage tail sheath gpL-like
MASQTTIVVTHNNETTADLKHRFQAPSHDSRGELLKLQQLLNRLAGGASNGSLTVTIDDGDKVAASGTITFSGVTQANDTVLINGVTFTAVASGATGNQWNVGASATLSAASLAAAINASATALVNLQVTASENGAGVITLTAINKGASGNAITLAEGVDGLTHIAVSGARLTGGTNSANSTAVSYALSV